ncbi:pentapeptide repeat-containing protein [Hymenobacter sp. B81]|uniref:pentapeptide repeat-containing protein n=1 Tax=Hymenobacter sp. B81 TaxID=3344878 RepID=UPI0037DD2A7F
MNSRRKPAARAKTAGSRKPQHFPADRVLSGLDAPGLRALGPELEQYHFIGCELGEADLSRLRFEDCLFERCNLSSARLAGSSLQNVAFADCKLLGLSFAACHDMLFAVHFDRCQLRYASFAGKRLAGTRFANCTLPEADFTNADLSQAVFADCDLTRAVFHDTRLEGADLSTATGYRLDPEANFLRGARFSLAGLPGLLDKYGLVVE